MASYEGLLNMCDLSSTFDEFHGEFNIHRLVESTKNLERVAHEKIKHFIDKLFDWIPRLIRRILNKLRNHDSTSPDRMVVIRNENDDDAVLIGIMENINGTGNILRNIITTKEVVSAIPRSEEYSKTVTTSELHSLNVMIQKTYRHWKDENAKRGNGNNNHKQFYELAKVLASVSKSLQRLLK